MPYTRIFARIVLVPLLCAGIAATARAVVAPDTTYPSGNFQWGMLLPDGRMMLNSVDDDLVLHLRRYDPDGRPDVTYGDSGVVDVMLPALTPNIRWGFYDYGSAVLADGSMFLSIRAWPRTPTLNPALDTAAPYGFYLMRVDAAGRVDRSFGTDGRIALDPAGTNLWHDGTVPLPDGGALVTLDHEVDYACAGSMSVLRVLPTGAVAARHDQPIGDCAVLMPKLLPGGQVALPSSTMDAPSVLDSTLQPLPASSAAAWPLLMQSGAAVSTLPAAGRSYVAVMNGTHLRVSAFDAALALVPGFGDQGSGTTDVDLAAALATVPAPTSGTAKVVALLMVSSGRHVLVGATVSGSTYYSATGHVVMRFNLDGSFDRGFGTGGFVTLSRSALAGSLTALAERDDGALWLTQGGFTRRLQTRAVRSSGVLGFGWIVPPTVPSAGDTVSMVVQRSLGRDGPVSVRYRTVDDTLKAGSDYVATSGRLDWADGDEADKTITVQVLAGTTNGRFTVVLEEASGGASVWSGSMGVSRFVSRVVTTSSTTLVQNSGQAGVSTTGGGGALSGVTLLGLLALWLRTRLQARSSLGAPAPRSA